MKRRWEYRLVYLDLHDRDITETRKTINNLGAEGWEDRGMLPETEYARAVILFRRRLPPEGVPT